jgi:hypothetical protein
MPEESQKKYVTGLTPEEKEERRREQLRVAQLRFRESHGLIKPKISEEEKQQRRKVKAKERYAIKKQQQEKKPDQVPTSYTVDYQRNYHRSYYEKNKDKLLSRSKNRYFQKKTDDPIQTYDNMEKTD